MAEKTPLGQQLLATLKNVQSLMVHTNDPDRLVELSNQRVALLDAIAKLVDANLNKGSQEYKAATAALQDASDMAQNAIKGLESVAKAIASVAKAVDVVSKLIPA